jgi:redox-sensitive bicupin YhaK (pirin superfamily)
MHWKTYDPFLFCAHHWDNYPQSVSNGSDHASLGPDRKHLRGRDLGSDFSGLNGFNMYHGEVVPGFPSHPHYGFETLTVVRKGLVDHFDSHGYTARYGEGDAQFLTTGAGIQHSEMFPLVHADKPNSAELFQIWINLPQAKKRSKPFFSMAWAAEQPKKSYGAPGGPQAQLRLVVGAYDGLVGVRPPPDSYASDPRSEMVVATFKLDPGAKFVIPAASSSDLNRALYFFNGSGVKVDNRLFTEKVVLIKLAADREVEVSAEGTEPVELLLLQGRPLNEPVVQQGPFVTGSREELMQVFQDYRRTQFGGWRWGRKDPVHPRSQGRFYEIEGKRVEAPPLDEQMDVEQKECDTK